MLCYARSMSETQKPLLCFAHKAEAQYFLNHSKTKLLVSGVYSAWELDDFYVLLSGEGPEPALFSSSCFLSQFTEKVTEVVNIGVAGSLSPKLETGKIYHSSVIIKESQNREPDFKSFESLEADQKQYCITALDRVKTDDYANELSSFAEMVDREAWGFAYSANAFKKVFKCFKLISDRAGDSTQCFDVKEKASEYSYQLYRHYTSTYSEALSSNTDKGFLDLEPEFHFSSTQRKQFEKNSLLLKAKSPEEYELIFSEKNLKEIISESNRPKDRSRILLEEIQNSLNPFHNAIYDKLHSWFKDRPNSIKQVQTDPQWEKDSIKLNIEIKEKNDISEINEFLNSIPFDEFKRIFQGEF